VGQSWFTNESGRFFSNNTLSKKLRAMAQPMVRFRQFAKAEPGFAKRSGDTLLFDKVLNVDAGVTDGALIPEGEPIPRAEFRTKQGSCIAKASGLGIGWTEEYESFSEFEVRDPISSRLSDHMSKALDYRTYNDGFNSTSARVVYTPVGDEGGPKQASWSVTGTAGTAATRDTSVWDLITIGTALKEGLYNATTSAPCPTYDGDNYICIGSVSFATSLRHDPAWVEAAKYGDPERLYTSEIGRIHGFRVIEDNHIGRRFTNGFSGEATIFGEDAVFEIVVTPEEIREALPADFGRDMALAWYALLGFAAPWDLTNDGDNRIVRIRSL